MRRTLRSTLAFALAALLAPAACVQSREPAPASTLAVTTPGSDRPAEPRPLEEEAQDAVATVATGAPTTDAPKAEPPPPPPRDTAAPYANGPVLPAPKPSSPDSISGGAGVLGVASREGDKRVARQSAIEAAKERADGRVEGKNERRALARKVPAKDDARDEAGAFVEGGEFVSAGTNPLVDPTVDALSTFAIDVDTGSYTLSRRYLENGSMPPAQAVRVEEWVNAFHYSYADDAGEHPFSIHMEGAPLSKRSYVMRIGIQGKRIEKAERAPVHLTFLADVSGSMSGADRLPLAKKALAMLVDELGPKDSVGLVTYAGDTRVVLAATAVTNANRGKIKSAIEDLRNGGGTAMGSGMELAYREAGKALGDKGVSRVIVLSDGDANIGRTSHEEMLKSIKGYVSEGVTMSTVGFGTGNLRDHLMEQLANAGNGNYSYVGSAKDAKRIFVDDLTGTLQVIAKDTKIQVEMNKDVVESYRLIGYENRDIADRDFRNDKVDAGEIGAGHTVTALYEVNLKTDDATSDIATVRVRYKQPRGEKATEVSARFLASSMKHSTSELSMDGKFATGVALTAETFRHSEHMDRLGIGLAEAHALLVQGAKGAHAEERMELVRLIAPLAAGAPVVRR